MLWIICVVFTVTSWSVVIFHKPATNNDIFGVLKFFVFGMIAPMFVWFGYIAYAVGRVWH